MSAGNPFISFLSDYGLRDELVGVCHGVIARRCPQARVIDITHEIPPQDVLIGARTLRDSIGLMPVGVHLAVVDPGVGASGAMARRAVALQTRHEGRWLVGPDNGLLAPAADALGGISEALDLGASPERLLPVSSTFHGRDIFAPVAAALADGARPESVGEPLDPTLLKGLLLPAAGISSGALRAHVAGIDRFGNVALDGTAEQLEQIGLRMASDLEIEAHGQRSAAIRARTFADVPPGALLLFEDSREMVALAVNEGSAAQALGLSHGDPVEVRQR
jgi:S-adenosylmethionine hydrolase